MFTVCYGSDAPDDVVRRLTQTEQRPIPPELSVVFGSALLSFVLDLYPASERVSNAE